LLTTLPVNLKLRADVPQPAIATHTKIQRARGSTRLRISILHSQPDPSLLLEAARKRGCLRDVTGARLRRSEDLYVHTQDRSERLERRAAFGWSEEKCGNLNFHLRDRQPDGRNITNDGRRGSRRIERLHSGEDYRPAPGEWAARPHARFSRLAGPRGTEAPDRAHVLTVSSTTKGQVFFRTQSRQRGKQRTCAEDQDQQGCKSASQDLASL